MTRFSGIYDLLLLLYEMDSKSEEIVLEVYSYKSALIVVLCGILIELEAVTLKVSYRAVDEVSGDSYMTLLSEMKQKPYYN